MTNSSVRVTYLGHSGFMLRFPEATLIFDWSEGELTNLPIDLPLYFFVSHTHADHFNWNIFYAAEHHPHCEIFLGFDHQDERMEEAFSRQSEKALDCLSCFDGEQNMFSEDRKLHIYTLRSTDMGVAFLVELYGKTIFHAGDLFLMQTASREKYLNWCMDTITKNPGAYVDSYENYLEKRKAEFEEYTEPLRGREIDYGMIPMDPRFAGVGYKTVQRYMEIAKFKKWSPMHLWGQYEFVDQFVTDNPEYGINMMGPTQKNGVHMRMKIGQSYWLFNL